MTIEKGETAGYTIRVDGKVVADKDIPYDFQRNLTNGAKRREFSCAYAEVKGFSEPKGEWSKAKRVQLRLCTAYCF